MANVIVFGDSVAFGFYDNQGGWATRLITYFSKIEPPEKDHHTKIYNMAISGATTATVLDQIDPILKHRSWNGEQTIVIVQIGKNDAALEGRAQAPGTGLGEFESNLKQIVTALRKYTANILFIGLAQVDEKLTSPVTWDKYLWYKNELLDKYDNQIKSFCASEKVDYLPIPENFRGKPNLLADGLHPSPEGHEVLFKLVLKWLEKKTNE